MSNKTIPFGDLSKKDKQQIISKIPIGIVEVCCPWWPDNHWEDKLDTQMFDEACYRIKSKSL